MAFPSKRDIKGRVTNGESVVSFPKGFIWPSKVTFLEIYQSAIDTASFSGSLCEIRGPLRFVYSFRAGALVGDQRWEPCQIVRIFDVHTGKILSISNLLIFRTRNVLVSVTSIRSTTIMGKRSLAACAHSRSCSRSSRVNDPATTTAQRCCSLFPIL